MREKKLATEMLGWTRQVKTSKYLRLNFYVVLHPATRSSRSQMFFKMSVLKNFAKFIGKTCTGLRPITLLKKRSWHRCFPLNFAKFLRAPLFRTPPVAASVHLYRIWIKSRALLKDFYCWFQNSCYADMLMQICCVNSCYPLRVTLSSYLSD